jgi:predicted phosphodiesterase
MKILVISDIHGNLTALEAVLASVEAPDAVWCLGDLVGYGPDANEVVDRIRNLPNLVCIKGNHDAATAGNRNIDKFHDEAQAGIKYARKTLSEENMAFLKSLPETVEKDDAMLAHGSPREPIWEYVVESYTAKANFAFFDKMFGFVGHSHIPVLFTLNANTGSVHRHLMEDGEIYQISSRVILNPGSVGQPRDNNPRSCYGIFDPDERTWTIHRVAYDIPAVQARFVAARLPRRQSTRLTEGW